MAKVYLVSAGEYSDYWVAGVFTTEELAKAAMQLRPDWVRDEHWNDIVEWDINDTSHIIGNGESVIPCYRARVRLTDGAVTRGEECGCLMLVIPGSSDSFIWQSFIDTLSSISMDHAVKIAVEARQKWLREKGQA